MPTLAERPSVGAPPPIIPRVPGGRGGDSNGGPDPAPSGAAARIAIYVGMCASTMTFAALVSAMVVRRGLGNNDWHKIAVSPILWWNTAALLLSSVVIEIARRAFCRGARPRFRLFWLTGTALGTWFLIGQAIVWRKLASIGVFLRHDPADAFFYVLTWAHAAHVVGALIALYFVAYGSLFHRMRPGNRTVIEISAIFWHFLDVMWLVLMSLFVLWS